MSWLAMSAARRLRVLCAALGFFMLVSLSASGPRAQNSVPAAEAGYWITLLETRYRAAVTSQATFLERYSESGHITRVEAGTAYFRRPGKMRWEYVTPERNLFLVDGKTAWFYVPADHTVTRVPAKHSADWRTPLALLAGDMKLSRVCSHVQLAVNERPLNASDIVLDCQLRGAPKNKPANLPSANGQNDGRDTTVFLELNRGSGELARVLVSDKGGVSIEFRFENWQFNPVVAEAQFAFRPPMGVAILNGELPAQAEFVK
jgi:outer membrane lipoprotein carrier protein